MNHKININLWNRDFRMEFFVFNGQFCQAARAFWCKLPGGLIDLVNFHDISFQTIKSYDLVLIIEGNLLFKDPGFPSYGCVMA
jgi:protein-disulfide isomerase